MACCNDPALHHIFQVNFYYLGLIWGYMGASREVNWGQKGYLKIKYYILYRFFEIRKRVPKNKVPPPMLIF